MILTEAADILWRTNAHLIRWDDLQDVACFFGAFTACARTCYASVESSTVAEAALTWIQASTGSTYKESLRLFGEINGTRRPQNDQR